MRVLATVRTAPARLTARLHTAGREAGMTTSEYAVGTVAACGFGGGLYKLLTSEPVRDLLREAIEKGFGFVL